MKASCNTSDLEHDYQFFVCTSGQEEIRAVSLFPGSEGPSYIVDFFTEVKSRHFSRKYLNSSEIISNCRKIIVTK